MRIVITGAAGFIGSHLFQNMARDRHHVVGLDSFDGFLYPSSVKEDNARELEATIHEAPSARLVRGDICDPEAVANVITEDTDVVCHLAALAGVRPSLERPDLYIRANMLGLTTVLERMREVGCKRLVFASSSSVYGAKSGPLKEVEAFREDDPCLTPASPYAATKRAGELLCSTYRDLFGIGVSNLRFFTVYGPRQRPDMAIHKFTAAIAGNRPITVFGDGESRRDYTFIDDIIAGTRASCERIEPGAFTAYNLGGTETTSLSELVATIEEVVGKKANIDRQPMQPGDVPITFADITNAQRDLDYKPTTNVKTGVSKFWDWYRDKFV